MPANATSTRSRRAAKSMTSSALQYGKNSGKRHITPISGTWPPKWRQVRPCATSCAARLSQMTASTPTMIGGEPHIPAASSASVAALSRIATSVTAMASRAGTTTQGEKSGRTRGSRRPRNRSGSTSGSRAFRRACPDRARRLASAAIRASSASSSVPTSSRRVASMPSSWVQPLTSTRRPNRSAYPSPISASVRVPSSRPMR